MKYAVTYHVHLDEDVLMSLTAEELVETIQAAGDSMSLAKATKYLQIAAKNIEKRKQAEEDFEL